MKSCVLKMFFFNLDINLRKLIYNLLQSVHIPVQIQLSTEHVNIFIV